MVVRDQQPERVAGHGLSAFWGRDRELHDKPCSRAVHSWSDLEASTKLCCSLSHRQETNTDYAVRIETDAVVLDSQSQPVGGLQTDLADVRGRVLGNVGNCFFRDPVDGNLDGSGKHRKIRCSGHPDSQRCVPRMFTSASVDVTARLVSCCPFSERADQPQLIKRRRAQSVDQATDVRYGGSQFSPQLGSLLLSSARVSGDRCAERPGLDSQSGELGAEAIVEITAQSSPLLLPSGDNPLARALEISGEPHRVRGNADLACQVLQQLPVSRAENLSRTAWSDD